MHEIVVGLRAIADLLDIYLYGIETFGPLQADRYRTDLDAIFGKLAAFPKMGRSASVIGEGIRRHEHASHVILYREEKDALFVIRVIHARSVRGLEL